jgi:hypothetical protein
MKILQENKEYEYKVYQSDLIINNNKEFIDDCYKAVDRFNLIFKNKSSTWTYTLYNVFSLSAGSILFYNLYKELTQLIRSYSGTNEELWFQSWINFHKSNEVLDWHNHQYCKFHGYLSIDPKNSKTVFDNYEILNSIGSIYIGKAKLNNKDLLHKVVVLEPYDGY